MAGYAASASGDDDRSLRSSSASRGRYRSDSEMRGWITVEPGGRSAAGVVPARFLSPMLRRSFIINGKILAAIIRNTTSQIKELVAPAWKECPNCRYPISNGDVASQWPGLPLGVKFEPSDQDLLTHLAGKVGSASAHVFIDDFIPTIEEVEGICYTHPENLPGIKMDGRSYHFFHRTSNAYDVGQRKCRKISSSNDTDCDQLIRWQWHKTGKSKPILDNGVIKGWKQILVLHKGKTRVKTNWTIHQCHLGVEKYEKHGELVVSRVFWQVKSNNTGESQMHAADVESGSSAVTIDPTTPNMYAPQPRPLSGSPLETEQNQDEEEPGSSAGQLKADAEDVAGSSQSVDYGVLPDLDEHPLLDDDMPGARQEKPDYPGMDELHGFSDMDYAFLQTPLDFPALTDGLISDWLTENVA